MSRRYAVYYAPPAASPLEAFGCRWLGRDHVGGQPVQPPALAGLGADEQREITAFPRHYGFHATLKAPFELAPGRTPQELYAAVDRFAGTRMRFHAPPLRLEELSGFIAFTLSAPSPAMEALAAACVGAFEPFRAPLSESELARRRAGGLTPRQEAHLVRWGYPYVFDEFRFHLTLTGRLADPLRGRVLDVLRPLAADLTREPLPVEAISLYEQPARAAPFRLTARFPLA